MEISVLIPSHHNSPLLQRCIDSVIEAATKESSVDVDIVVIAHNQSYNDINSSLPIHIYHAVPLSFMNLLVCTNLIRRQSVVLNKTVRAV